jgi:serine protease Do
VTTLVTLTAKPSHAQLLLRADAERAANNIPAGDVLVSHAEREREYQSIQQEADVLQRQISLVRRIVSFAMPSVVHIEASKKAEGNDKNLASSRVDEAGAGVIVAIRNQLYVLTNRHVVHPAEPAGIRLEMFDGRHLRPSRIWVDPATDVAVMQIDGRGFVPAKLGDSDDMQMGDHVIAVGSPFGLSHSVTYGILSAKGRRNLELGSREIEIQDFFQTDAAINPGNSGGPLLNMRGEVIGINTAIASNSGGNEGIGFTIPINMAVYVADQLITRGKLNRARLGVVLENAYTSAMARQLGLPNNEGALVKSILPKSPAEKAGLQVGDVILEFDGTRVENDGHLVKTVGLTPIGKQVKMIIHRQNVRQEISIVTEAMATDPVSGGQG